MPRDQTSEFKLPAHIVVAILAWIGQNISCLFKINKIKIFGIFRVANREATKPQIVCALNTVAVAMSHYAALGGGAPVWASE